MGRIHAATRAGGILGATLAGLFFATPGPAWADCPTLETVGRGFYLQGSSARSEIRHLGDHFVQAKTRYSDGVVQTDLYYDGLFAVSRVSNRGAQMMYNAKFEDWQLDLKQGAKASLSYTPIVDSEPLAETTLELEVKGSEVFKLGACDLTVHVISQTRKRAKSTRQFDQLYSPLLKFVIARRYPNGDTRAYRGVEVMP